MFWLLNPFENLIKAIEVHFPEVRDTILYHLLLLLRSKPPLA